MQPVRWAGHVARVGEERGCIGWGNRRERDHWRDIGVDGWIILGWITKNFCVLRVQSNSNVTNYNILLA